MAERFGGVKTMLDYTPEKHSYVPAPPTVTPRPLDCGRGVSSIHVFPRPLPQPRGHPHRLLPDQRRHRAGAERDQMGLARRASISTAGRPTPRRTSLQTIHRCDPQTEPMNLSTSTRPSPTSPPTVGPSIAGNPASHKARSLAGITAACAQSSTDQPNALRPQSTPHRHPRSHRHLDPSGSRLRLLIPWPQCGRGTDPKGTTPWTPMPPTSFHACFGWAFSA